MVIRVILSILLGYFLGSIPFALIVARLVKGIDIRKVGTKNPGAANVYREVGKRWGILVWLLDTIKGVIAMLIAHKVIQVIPPVIPTHLGLFFVVMTGVAAVAGHCWSPFLGFKGGRGVATSGGVIFYILPKVFPFGVGLYFLYQKRIRTIWGAFLGLMICILLAFMFYRKEFGWLGPALLIFFCVAILANIPTIKEIRTKTQ
ncbi:MAG TPA: glycerol-3-phosphate acyltransferase [bacterium (Candidatus Stahlbacteria)]|nr:glycerol-3-phosphate acyltransferase [Candidatus Stahlbacteria bacterium]